MLTSTLSQPAPPTTAFSKPLALGPALTVLIYIFYTQKQLHKHISKFNNPARGGDVGYTKILRGVIHALQRSQHLLLAVGSVFGAGWCHNNGRPFVSALLSAGLQSVTVCLTRVSQFKWDFSRSVSPFGPLRSYVKFK